MAAFGPTKAIREHCEITSSKRIYAADYQPDGVPFYRGKEIIEKHKGNLEVSTELFVSETKFSEIKAKFGAPQPGDLLLTSVGTLGVPYVVKPGEVFYFKDGNLTWFRNFTGLDSRFLYYWLLSPLGKSELKKCTIGSSQSAFTIVLLKDMAIVLPSLLTQRKIAAILSAYDDLVENNTRRIKILEEMAQTLYRGWFVNFCFPGHKKVRMVNSQLGKMPEGWEVREFGTIAEKRTIRFENGQDDTLPLLDLARIPRRSCAINDLGQSGEIKTSRIVFERDDILFGAIRPYFHKVVCAPFRGVTNTSVYVLRAQNDIPTSFLFSLVFSDETVRWANQHSGGMKMPVIAWDVFSKMNALIPPFDLLKAFDRFIAPERELIASLVIKNANLRRTRDLLLPKLISGEVAVEDLDIRVNG